MVSLVLVFVALLAYVKGDINVNYQGGHYGHNIESKYQLPPIQEIQTSYGPIRIMPFVQQPEVRTLYPVKIQLTTGHIAVPAGTFQLQKNENGWIFTHVTDFSSYPDVAKYLTSDLIQLNEVISTPLQFVHNVAHNFNYGPSQTMPENMLEAGDMVTLVVNPDGTKTLEVTKAAKQQQMQPTAYARDHIGDINLRRKKRSHQFSHHRNTYPPMGYPGSYPHNPVMHYPPRFPAQYPTPGQKNIGITYGRDHVGDTVDTKVNADKYVGFKGDHIGDIDLMNRKKRSPQSYVDRKVNANKYVGFEGSHYGDIDMNPYQQSMNYPEPYPHNPAMQKSIQYPSQVGTYRPKKHYKVGKVDHYPSPIVVQYPPQYSQHPQPTSTTHYTKSTYPSPTGVQYPPRYPPQPTYPQPTHTSITKNTYPSPSYRPATKNIDVSYGRDHKGDIVGKKIEAKKMVEFGGDMVGNINLRRK